METAVVYVVDDDQRMLDSTVWLLESVGLKVRPFTSGREFLDACPNMLTPVCCSTCACPGLVGWRYRKKCADAAWNCR